MLYMEQPMNQWAPLIDQDLLNLNIFMQAKLVHLRYVQSQQRKENLNEKKEEAIKQSCDIYFYEVARRLGVDRLAETSNKFGLGDRVFDILNEERTGLVPTTKWKLKNIGRGWVLGETLLAGIGQGYFQVTPIQLCFMTAQLANGGYKIKPKL